MGEVLTSSLVAPFCRLVNPTNCLEIPRSGGFFYSLTSRLALFGLKQQPLLVPFQRMALPATECSRYAGKNTVYHNVTLSVLHTFSVSLIDFG